MFRLGTSTEVEHEHDVDQNRKKERRVKNRLPKKNL
jgi:hypothetical protein